MRLSRRSLALGALAPLLSLISASHAHESGSRLAARRAGHLAQREGEYVSADDTSAAGAYSADAAVANDPSPTYDAPVRPPLPGPHVIRDSPLAHPLPSQAFEATAASAAGYGAPAPSEWSSPAAEAAYTSTSWAAEPTPTADWAAVSLDRHTDD